MASQNPYSRPFRMERPGGGGLAPNPYDTRDTIQGFNPPPQSGFYPGSEGYPRSNLPPPSSHYPPQSGHPFPERGPPPGRDAGQPPFYSRPPPETHGGRYPQPSRDKIRSYEQGPPPGGRGYEQGPPLGGPPHKGGPPGPNGHMPPPTHLPPNHYPESRPEYPGPRGGPGQNPYIVNPFENTGNAPGGQKPGYSFLNPVGGGLDRGQPGPRRGPRDDIYQTPAHPPGPQGFPSGDNDIAPPLHNNPGPGGRNFHSFVNPTGPHQQPGPGGPRGYPPQFPGGNEGPAPPSRGRNQRPGYPGGAPHPPPRDYEFRSPQRPYTDGPELFKKSKDDFYLNIGSPRNQNRYGLPPGPPAGRFGGPGGEDPYPFGYPDVHRDYRGPSRGVPPPPEFYDGIPPGPYDRPHRGPPGGHHRPSSPYRYRPFSGPEGNIDDFPAPTTVSRYHLSPEAQVFRNQHLNLDKNEREPYSRYGGGNIPPRGTNYGGNPYGGPSNRQPPSTGPLPSRYGGFPDYDFKPTPHYPPVGGENVIPYTPYEYGHYGNPDYQGIIKGAAREPLGGRPNYGNRPERDFVSKYGGGSDNPYLRPPPEGQSRY